MDNIVFRRNNRFHINNERIIPEGRRVDIINSLYAAIYQEFRGADRSRYYAHLNYLQRMEKLNEFAENWLKKRSLYNG